MSNKLRIVIDIGNSNIVIGLNNNKEWIKIYRINTKSEINYWSFEKKIKKILGENNISPSEIYSVTVSSVVPSMTDIIKLVINDFLFKEILLLVPETNNMINIKIDDISEIGSDLVANSIAARSTETLVIEMIILLKEHLICAWPLLPTITFLFFFDLSCFFSLILILFS